VPVLNDKDIMVEKGYQIDLWDALLLLEMIPLPKGTSPGPTAVRRALYALYDDLRGKIPDRNGEDHGSFLHVYKNELCAMLKGKSFYYCHQLSTAFLNPEWTDTYKEECAALSDFYASVYDRFREEL
jgi:hypothetical protein